MEKKKGGNLKSSVLLIGGMNMGVSTSKSKYAA